MTSKPRNKIRKNVQKFVDMDYLSTLSDSDKEYMQKFVDEYYCGSHWKEDSLHREAYGDKYDSIIKQDMGLNMNAQNRDITGIAGCSNKITSLEEVIEELLLENNDTLKDQLVTTPPEIILESMVIELSDEIKNLSPESLEDLLKNFALKSVVLFLLAKKETIRQRRIDKQSK